MDYTKQKIFLPFITLLSCIHSRHTACTALPASHPYIPRHTWGDLHITECTLLVLSVFNFFLKKKRNIVISLGMFAYSSLFLSQQTIVSVHEWYHTMAINHLFIRWTCQLVCQWYAVSRSWHVCAATRWVALKSVSVASISATIIKKNDYQYLQLAIKNLNQIYNRNMAYLYYMGAQLSQQHVKLLLEDNVKKRSLKTNAYCVTFYTVFLYNVCIIGTSILYSWLKWHDWF